jgi:hypothetical protein
VAPAVPLANPASVALQGGNLYITNAAFFLPEATPTLLRLPLSPLIRRLRGEAGSGAVRREGHSFGG